jgi:hypothetical protein
MGGEYPREKDLGKSLIKFTSFLCFYLLTQQLAGANETNGKTEKNNTQILGQMHIRVGHSAAQ